MGCPNVSSGAVRRALCSSCSRSRGEVVAVDRAADVLWGLELPTKPAEQVGVLVSRLRGVLGADHLIHRAGGYALEAAWLDIDEIDRRVEEASDAQAAGRLAVARAAADAALALVRGPLLPDEDGEWAEVARHRCESQVAAARRIKIEATFASGDWAAVVAQAEAVLAEHPYDEAVLRMLMRAHASSGSTAAALAAYTAGEDAFRRRPRRLAECRDRATPHAPARRQRFAGRLDPATAAARVDGARRRARPARSIAGRPR